ncbi:MAG: hypothetical protein RL308_1708 [Bacteroidota bacterium]|jgi:hypothetical protein
MRPKEQHEAEILKLIIKHKIMKIQHIFQHYTDLGSAQFYNLELEKSESIKEAIQTNKSKAVSYMLNKWVGSDNATLQISAFKVLCEDEDRKKLSMQFVESENSHQVRKFEVEILKPKNENTEQ